MTIRVQEIDERQWMIDRIEQLEVTNMSLEKRTYAAPHVWNLVAKILREEYERYTHRYPIASVELEYALVSRGTICDLALAFAKRFTEDEGFDPISWLDKCSPDPDLYPFSELWEENE